MNPEDNVVYRQLMDERFARVIGDLDKLQRSFEREMGEVKRDVRDIRTAQDASDKRLNNFEGRMAVWGGLGVIIGGVIGLAIAKGLGL